MTFIIFKSTALRLDTLSDSSKSSFQTKRFCAHIRKKCTLLNLFFFFILSTNEITYKIAVVTGVTICH